MMAAKILAGAAAENGFQVQAFSAYGAERRGGRVDGFIRVSEDRIKLHTKMYHPDVVVLFDRDLALDPATTADLKPDGIVLVNSRDIPVQWRGENGFQLYRVDADDIARQGSVVLPNGEPIINTTMLGALTAILPDINETSLYKAISESGVAKADLNVAAAKMARAGLRRGDATGDPTAKSHVPQKAQRKPKHQDKPSPCERDCPAGQNVRHFIELVSQGHFKQAKESLLSENPFSGTCGRVCFRPCQNECNAGRVGDAISIGDIERAAADHTPKNNDCHPSIQQATGPKVAVIGSGPAGMTCAYYLTLLGYQITVFEAAEHAGGTPRLAIPAYRLPPEIVEQEIDYIVSHGIDLHTGTTVGSDISFEEIMAGHEACFVSCGAHGHKALDIAGAGCQGVLSAIEFLKAVASKEQSQLGKRVVVIGGGNTAVDAARSAKRLGAEKVTILYRRSPAEMPAYREEVSLALEEGIEIQFLAAPVEVESSGGMITGLWYAETALGQPDLDGRRRPQIVDGSRHYLSADNLLSALGENVEASFLPPEVDRSDGLIKCDWLGRTSLSGVFAGGDATSWQRTVSHAIGAGKRAAMGIDLYLRRLEPTEKNLQNNGLRLKGPSMGRYMEGRAQEDYSTVIGTQDLKHQYLNQEPCVETKPMGAEQRILGFTEIWPGLTQPQASVEASRCFMCGHCNHCGNCFVFCPDAAVLFDQEETHLLLDAVHCKACGICLEECPRGAIALEGEGLD